MAQLHLYVPDAVAEELRQRAEAEGISTSKYLARMVSRQVTQGWPERWFERVVGRWAGELERAPTPLTERREAW